jgi:hypothetical protein
MDDVANVDQPSFEQRVLAFDEADLKHLEEAAGCLGSSESVRREDNTNNVIPFRNVFANHFNNVIRPREAAT